MPLDGAEGGFLGVRDAKGFGSFADEVSEEAFVWCSWRRTIAISSATRFLILSWKGVSCAGFGAGAAVRLNSSAKVWSAWGVQEGMEWMSRFANEWGKSRLETSISSTS